MLKTETLRYRPRSLSYKYDRDRCQHPNIPRQVGLIEQQAILSSPLEDDNEVGSDPSVMGQDGSPGARIESPVAPIPRNSEEWSKVEAMEEMTNRFSLSSDHLKHFEKRMVDEINRGLSKHTNAQANVKSFVTYVSKLPTGREFGKYLALDLGGTNFRVIMAELTAGTRSVRIKTAKFQVSKDLMTGPGEDLFDFMAVKLELFMLDNDLLTDEESGMYKCPGVEGIDVGMLLTEAIKKRPRISKKIEVAAILNDTTGCLMACAYKHPECSIGVIVGTGTNAAYVEQLDNVGTYQGPKPKNSSCVVINTEWGAFGNTGSLDIFRTPYDLQLDRESLNPGKQVYEKLISGMYLGELTRLIIVDAIKKDILGLPLDVFRKSRVFDTKHISAIEDDPRGGGGGKNQNENVYENMDKALLEVGMTKSQLMSLSEFDRKALRYLCECVTDRAAKLAGAGVAALANKINRPKLTVGMDGSVYKFHPNFGQKMKATARKLVCNCIDFKMVLSEDGSGRGAALAVAAQTSKFQYLV